MRKRSNRTVYYMYKPKKNGNVIDLLLKFREKISRVISCTYFVYQLRLQRAIFAL